MRKAMTEPEVMLWSRLRGRNPDKPTFRRQHPFGSIILDFYCPAARLAVEVDGATHWDEAAQPKDEARDRWLMTQGVRVHRVPGGANLSRPERRHRRRVALRAGDDRR